jgi:hypothetical protein
VADRKIDMKLENLRSVKLVNAELEPKRMTQTQIVIIVFIVTITMMSFITVVIIVIITIFITICVRPRIATSFPRIIIIINTSS